MTMESGRQFRTISGESPEAFQIRDQGIISMTLSPHIWSHRRMVGLVQSGRNPGLLLLVCCNRMYWAVYWPFIGRELKIQTRRTW